MRRHERSSAIVIHLIWCCAAGVVLAGSSSVQQAAAQQPPALTSAEFLGDPGQVLQHNPTGGAVLVSVLRDFAISNPTTLQTILNLLTSANASQKSAIGAALAQAAKIVVRTNPTYAGQIQQGVVRTKDQNVITAYTAVTGDVTITATGGIGGGFGGGSGGPTNPLVTAGGAAGGLERLAATPITTSPFSYTSSISSGGGVGSPTTAVNTVSSSVSP